VIVGERKQGVCFEEALNQAEAAAAAAFSLGERDGHLTAECAGGRIDRGSSWVWLLAGIRGTAIVLFRVSQHQGHGDGSTQAFFWWTA
jgi:hypothetical protein